MQFLPLLIIMLLLSGCMTANQLEAEKAYYNLQAMQIQKQQQQQSQPLFEIISHNSEEPIVMNNVAAIKVYQPINNNNNNNDNKTNFQQYRHQDYITPWTNLLGKTISLAVPAYAAYKTVDSLAKNVGSTTNYTSGGDIDVKRDTSNIASGQESIIDQSVLNDSSVNDSYNNDLNITDSWDSDSSVNDSYNNDLNITDSWDSDSSVNDSTHDPIIVEQPEPIVIE